MLIRLHFSDDVDRQIVACCIFFNNCSSFYKNKHFDSYLTALMFQLLYNKVDLYDNY